jgi:lipoic acid synthetase
MPSSATYFEVRDLLRRSRLATVCQSASCPNIAECWGHRSLTVLILGNLCTRGCRFCDVPSGRPLPPDPDEPRRVAEALATLGLRHAVITCVSRDDLADGGAAHWAETLRRVRAACPGMTVEALTGDFLGDTAALDLVLAARPDVLAHNLETVPRLAQAVRGQASHGRSLGVLRHAKQRGALTKSGLMLGLGEGLEEVREVMGELSALGCDILTLGQYLAPSRAHLPVARYVTPAEFEELAAHGRGLGIRHVEAGPLVRSSYHAERQRALLLTKLGASA